MTKPEAPGRHSAGAPSRLSRSLAGIRAGYVTACRWVVQPRNRLPVAVLLAALALAATVGLISVRGGGTIQGLPPTPPSPRTNSVTPEPSTPAAGPSTPAAVTKFSCGSTTATGRRGLVPTRICIPRIRVDAEVMSLGLNSDRTVQVPPLSRVGEAGWYRYSAKPGAVGPTVILGHVDSAQYGEGVFFRLGRLRTADKIVVSRDDGMVATFVVTKVSEVSKSRFPTDSVYGSTSGPAIRLVTCGGRFDSATGNYLDNIIAYGTLQSVRRG